MIATKTVNIGGVRYTKARLLKLIDHNAVDFNGGDLAIKLPTGEEIALRQYSTGELAVLNYGSFRRRSRVFGTIAAVLA